MPDRIRTTFDSAELAIVLSHYDLGEIESITDLGRGSTRSAKVGIVARKGKFLLKRRAAKRSQPERVRFAHRVQSYLQEDGFPAPAIIPVRDGRRGFVQLREQVYELFEFVPGHMFRWTTAETRDAGRTLAHFHQATARFQAPPDMQTPYGDFHDAPAVRTGLLAIGSTLSSHESFTGDEAELATLIQFLLEAYECAAEAVNRQGIAEWPERIIHADWHPGNLLFRNGAVVAVVDYDAVRQSRRVIDLANGALQFSMTAGQDPATWPDHVDENRFAAYWEGYQSREPIPGSEARCVPDLMVEALIAECVPPITETGSIGRWSGFRVLKMIRRKLMWLQGQRERLIHRLVEV